MSVPEIYAWQGRRTEQYAALSGSSTGHKHGSGQHKGDASASGHSGHIEEHNHQALEALPTARIAAPRKLPKVHEHPEEPDSQDSHAAHEH